MSIIGSVSLTATDSTAFTESLDRIMSLADSAVGHGGWYLAKGGSLKAVTGGAAPDRVLVLEFEHMGQIRAWLDSAEFTEFEALAGSCADIQAMIVEGQ